MTRVPVKWRTISVAFDRSAVHGGGGGGGGVIDFTASVVKTIEKNPQNIGLDL